MNPLKAARLKAGFENRGDAAKALRVDRSTLGRWEREENQPSKDDLIAMADLYGVSIDELVGRTPSVA